MNRREWLVAIGGVAAFAGCSELTDDSDDQTLDPTSGNDTEASGDGDREQSETSESGAAGGSGSGGDPTDTVVAYFQAIDQGNLDRAGETIHPDSPEGREELRNLREQDQELTEQIEITVEEVQTISQDGQTAVVEATATTNVAGEEQTQTTQLELRPDDGTWKIWGEVGDSEETSEEQEQDSKKRVAGENPVDTVVAYYQAIDQGNLDRIAEVSHPDSSGAQEELERLEQQNQEFFEQISITVQEATVITQEQDRAVVEVTATTELNGEEQTQTTQLELRPDDGTWKIWGDGSDEADETDSSSGNVDGDPAQVVVAFYDALNNARREELAELTHPDGPARTQLESLAEDDYQTWEEIEVGVDSTTVLEETDNRATVEAEVSFQSDTNVLQIELRPTAGRWRIWATQ
jgi:ketosteroid isomerase-like protein